MLFTTLGLDCYVCFFRILMPHKKIILFTDNFEYDLIRQKDKNITTFIEKLIVYLNEFIGLKNSDLVSYITRQDKNAMDKFYGIKKAEI